jgi:hypothetical protein
MRQALFFVILILGITLMHIWHHFVTYFVTTFGNVAGLTAIAGLILLGFVLDPYCD